MKTTILSTLPTQFDMCGQAVCAPLKDTGKTIQQALAATIYDYAAKRAKDIGLWKALFLWDVEIYTMDGDNSPMDCSYNVRWQNKQGVSIELCQIMLRNGKPFLDHRFSLSEF